MNEVYVTHTCKNSKLKPIQKGVYGDKTIEKIQHPDYCDRGWVDLDKNRSNTLPPNWKYCPECVKKGFKNPKTRPDNLTEEQKQKRLENLQRGRLNKINSAFVSVQ